MTTLVSGAGGFIGHLVAQLLKEGQDVRAVDLKPLSEWYQVHAAAENVQGDCSLLETARKVSRGVQHVYNLAADMGGMGFIENNKAACMLTVLTSTHMLMAAQEAGAERYFYSSSACVYAAEHQTSTDVVALREADAYPAQPEDGYGWEKLFSERMAALREDLGCRPGSPDTTMSTGRTPGTGAGGRAGPAPFSGWRDRNMDLRSGATGVRPAALCIDDCVRAPKVIRCPTSPLTGLRVGLINQMAACRADPGTVVTRRYNPARRRGARPESDNTLYRATYG
jgi:hypothetical protein